MALVWLGLLHWIHQVGCKADRMKTCPCTEVYFDILHTEMARINAVCVQHVAAGIPSCYMQVDKYPVNRQHTSRAHLEGQC